MIISLSTQESAIGNRIKPLVQDDTLTDQLTQLAKTHQLPLSVLERDFKAEANDVLPLYAGESVTWLVGLGTSPQEMDWLKTFRKFFFNRRQSLPTQLLLDLTAFDGSVVEAVVLGIRWGGYDLKLYQTDKPEAPVFYSDAGQLTLLVAASQQAAAQEALVRAEAIAPTHRQMLDLMNAPSNYKKPQTLADWAVLSGSQHGYAVTILDREELVKQKLGALLSVSEGSEAPPVLIIAEHKPATNPSGLTVGLVGKGVTFDTGGLSIKPSTSMHLMKSDMGGAAAVLGTVEVAAKLNLPIHVVGIVPATENSVDSRSTKPGDVITSYSGKTIEIIDTDAEGRVILADGLAYMVRHFQPDILIDLATLDG